MVIYETISGNLPFHKDADLIVFMKVVEGERPHLGDKFTRSLSWVLEQCWAPKPNDRPSIEDVLQCLKMASTSPGPSSPTTDEGTDDDDDDWDPPTSSSGGDSIATDDRVQLPPIHSLQDRHLTGFHHTRPSVSSWAMLERECSWFIHAVPFSNPPSADDDRFGPTLPTPNPELLFPPRESPELFGPRSSRESF